MTVKRKRKAAADGSFGLKLREFFQAVRATAEEALRPTGFTPPQSMVLTIMSREPGITGAELARRAMITPQTMGELLTGLEKGGLIRRQRHPDNARMQAIFLTEAGTAAQAVCRAGMQALEDRMLAQMNATERKSFGRLLARATEGMRKQD